MSNYKDCIILVAISIVVLAGGIASGLGQVAMGTSYRENFPMLFGSAIMVVGSILFVVQLLILKCRK